MKFIEPDRSTGFLISAYEPGRIRVGGYSYGSSLIVAPNRLLDHWRPESVEHIEPEDFLPVLSLDPEIIVLGTGAVQTFPDPAVYTLAINRGLGLEIMDTGAACRTYNVLVSEGRRVVAALIML